MERTLRRSKENCWCEVTIKLENGRLSITGAYGSILNHREAKSQAFEYWESFFQDSQEELAQMALKFGVRNAKSAARKVLDVDGDFHGLDVHLETGTKVLVTEGCGQCVDEIAKWFPEIKPLLPWHLNDMHAECEHQEKLGWTFKTHEGQKCPECGYQIGTKWLKRELPVAVLSMARYVCKNFEVAMML